MFDPVSPPYDIAEWRKLPFADRMRMVCQAWSVQGYGTPPGIYLLYVAKILLLYVGGWCFFVSFTPGLGSPLEMASWAFLPIAFQKAVIWNLAYEGMGLGCASGPLTGRYMPPIGGALYFLRPGTIKMPFVPGLPIFGGTRRTLLDVAIYVAHYVFLFRALVAPEITPELLYPTVVLLPLLGLTDKTAYLASRAEHHFTALVVLAFAPGWIAPMMVVWVAIWMWAATSKMNKHFPGVITVMLSNSPFVPASFRKRLYRDHPNDLRPAPMVAAIAHLGTLTELTFPILLVLGDGGALTVVALIVMLGFHTFISANMPMGMPVEWNVIMVYGGFFLFGANAEVPLLAGLAGTPPLLLAFLALQLFVIPLFGNLVPSRVSFLSSMRYYAGNWAYSVWLFRGDSFAKLDRLTKVSAGLRQQLERMVDDPELIDGVLSRMPGFRFMHLHGRVLHDLIPKAVDDIDEYEWHEGEVIAGIVLGWNFGDGHLHDERLLAAVQEQCGFEPGELRVMAVESQPFGRPYHDWVIADAATGRIASGRTEVSALLERQPWPERAPASADALS